LSRCRPVTGWKWTSGSGGCRRELNSGGGSRKTGEGEGGREGGNSKNEEGGREKVERETVEGGEGENGRKLKAGRGRGPPVRRSPRASGVRFQHPCLAMQEIGAKEPPAPVPSNLPVPSKLPVPHCQATFVPAVAPAARVGRGCAGRCRRLRPRPARGIPVTANLNITAGKQGSFAKRMVRLVRS
jgi:hypothetical protein